MTFMTDGDDFRNKVLRDKIDVSVVLDMECVDMFTQCSGCYAAICLPITSILFKIQTCNNYLYKQRAAAQLHNVL